MLWAGFEPAHLAIVELESTPLDRSGTKAFVYLFRIYFRYFIERIFDNSVLCGSWMVH